LTILIAHFKLLIKIFPFLLSFLLIQLLQILFVRFPRERYSFSTFVALFRATNAKSFPFLCFFYLQGYMDVGYTLWIVRVQTRVSHNYITCSKPRNRVLVTRSEQVDVILWCTPFLCCYTKFSFFFMWP